MISFIDFLKKYSTIPTKFLNDFYKLFNYKENSEEKIVNIDDVINWLGIQKHKTKETLLKL
jgi:hypothetical protein